MGEGRTTGLIVRAAASATTAVNPTATIAAATIAVTVAAAALLPLPSLPLSLRLVDHLHPVIADTLSHRPSRGTHFTIGAGLRPRRRPQAPLKALPLPLPHCSRVLPKAVAALHA